MNKLTQEEFIEKANIVHNFRYDYSKTIYNNNKLKITIICHIHGEFLQQAGSHLSGFNCAKCHHSSLGFNKRISREEYVIKANDVHFNKYSYEKLKYIKMIEFGIITCPIHGEFEQRLCDHINCKAGCPKCNSSKGEIAIRHYLASRDINFEEQKTFSGCKDKIRLRFDFYLPDYNLCIEFDGQQHFKPNYPRNNKELALLNLQSLQRRDNIKTQYCTDNNIKLLRVSYIKLKNIDYILTKYLQTNPVWIHHN